MTTLPNRLLRCTTAVACAALLASCGSITSTGKVDYKTNAEAKQPAALDVPPDLSQLSRDSRYVVPGNASVSASALPAAQVGLRKSVATDGIGDVQFERLGSQRWLRVQRPAERVWDRVKSFWVESGFVLNTENAELGLIETEWAENRAKIPQDFLRRTLGKMLDSLYSTGERDKYRIRVERLDNNTTEIFVTHRGMQEVYVQEDKTGTRWQPRPSDPSLETEMMRRLMVYLGSSEAQATQAVAVTTSGAASLVSWSQGQTFLLFSDRFDVAWRRTSVALDRAGFTVEDRDRKAGVFFVRFIDRPEETGKEQGFFSRIFSSTPQASAPVRMRVAVQEDANNKTRISVLNESGQPDTGAVAQKMIRLINDELK